MRTPTPQRPAFIMPRPTLLVVLILPLALAAAEPGRKPAPPRDTARLIDLLFAAPLVERPKLAPDGSHLAFIREIKGRKLLVTYDFATGKPASIGGSWEQDIVDFHWTGPDALIFQVGAENIYYVGLWTADENLKRNRRIDTEGRVLGVLDPLPQAPESALLREQPRDNYFAPLLRLNLASGRINIEERNPGRVLAWHLDREGVARLATTATARSGRSYLYRPDRKSKWEPIDLPADSTPLALDATGQNMMLRYANPEGRQVVGLFDLAHRQLKGGPITDPRFDIFPSIQRDPRTGAPISLAYHTDRPRQFWLYEDYKILHDRLAPAFPGASLQIIGLMPGEKVLFAVHSDTQPPAYYTLRLGDDRASLLFSTMTEASKFAWSPMHSVRFKARDGYELHGYVTLPPGFTEGKPVPFVAVIHGGPYARDTWGFDPEAQFFASLGYGVLQLNYRGSAGYGRAHLLQNHLEVCDKSVDDVADGLLWAVGNGYADRARLAAYGGSFGGYIAVALATRHPDLLAATIGSAGVYDWEAEIRHDSREMRALFTWRDDYYPDPRKNADRYRAVSPVHQAGRVQAPVLLLHGAEDRIVDITQTNSMARALKKAGQSVEVVKDAEGIHGLPEEKSRRNLYTKVAGFLARHVPADTP
jgi:dipeptidyl aminopeptidase/acylaminoacyl peptidase